MVLALIAISSMLVISNFDFLHGGFIKKPVDFILRKAVYGARYQAAKINRPVFLSFDPETKSFEVRGESGELLGEGFDSEADALTVEFFPIKPEGGLDAPPFYQPVSSSVERVPFHPDRSSAPFLAELQSEGTTLSLRFDPFSNASFAEK